MKNVQLDLTLHHKYEVELEIELPTGLREGERRYYYPGASEEGGRDGLAVRVIPYEGLPWIGIFAPGYPEARTGVFSCPDGKSICVVSSGQAYIVRTDAPHKWEKAPAFPVWDVRVVLERNLLVLADFTILTAYGPEGLTWTTARLSWDGLEITEISGDSIRGLAWDSPQGRNVEFVVDLQSGRHIGGSSPENTGA
jgi:hypothetical protein